MSFYQEIIGKPLVLWKKRNFETAYEEIPSLDIELAGECNLNCKSCSHFSPVAEPEKLSIEEFERDLKQLAQVIPDKIRKILALICENGKLNCWFICNMGRKYIEMHLR